MQKLRRYVIEQSNREMPQVEDYLTNGQRFFQGIQVVPDFEKIKKQLPINTGHLIIQFSSNKEHLYLGFMHIDE